MFGGKFIAFLIGISTVLILISCSLFSLNDDDNEQIIRINHYKKTAFGPFPCLVYQSQQNEELGTDTWSNFYDPIEGFNYEPGYIYLLKVSVSEIPNPPQDGSDKKYKLSEILEKDPVDPDLKFPVKLKWAETNFVTGDSQMILLNEYPIDCQQLCDELAENLENSNEVTGIFTHDGNALNLMEFQ